MGKVVVSFKADPELAERIRRCAKSLDKSIGEIIRRAVIEYLEKLDRCHEEDWRTRLMREAKTVRITVRVLSQEKLEEGVEHANRGKD